MEFGQQVGLFFKRVLRANHKGDMIDLGGRQLEILNTPGHGVLTFDRRRSLTQEITHRLQNFVIAERADAQPKERDGDV